MPPRVTIENDLCEVRGAQRNFTEPYVGTVKENLLQCNKAILQINSIIKLLVFWLRTLNVPDVGRQLQLHRTFHVQLCS
jgi:hypothetical protein